MVLRAAARFITGPFLIAPGENRLKLRAEAISALFGLYFITVASGAILVASGTPAPWFDPSTSSLVYGLFLVTYLILLVAIAIFGSIQRRTKGANPSLSILAGPAIVAALYIGVAAIMLPAAAGFLQTNFRMNTAAILTLTYSWLGLAFYFAAAIGVVFQQQAASTTPVPKTDILREEL